MVTVTCSNGRTFTGDAVLVTVPLGVLKKGCIAFQPPLPERKLQSIQAMVGRCRLPLSNPR